MRVNSNAVNTQLTNVNFSASVRHGRKPAHRQMLACTASRAMLRLAVLAGLFVMSAVAVPGYAEMIVEGPTQTIDSIPFPIPDKLIVGDTGDGAAPGGIDLHQPVADVQGLVRAIRGGAYELLR